MTVSMHHPLTHLHKLYKRYGAENGNVLSSPIQGGP